MRLTCERVSIVCEPSVFVSDEVTKVERFIYAPPVILYAPAALQAASINN